jgi:hypothetical protein
VYNAVAVIGPKGQLITKHRKTHLAKEAGEEKYFTEAPIQVATSTYHHPGIGRVGLAVCSDVDDDGGEKEDLMHAYRETKPMTFDEASASLRKHQANQIKRLARELFGVDVEVGEFSLSITEAQAQAGGARAKPWVDPATFDKLLMRAELDVMRGRGEDISAIEAELFPHDPETRT